MLGFEKKQDAFGSPRPASRSSNPRWRSFWMMLPCLALLYGCYPDWPENAGTAEIHGEVSLDGLPVNDAQVIFVPANLRNANDKIMPMAYGTTDPDGKFRMEYSKSQKGGENDRGKGLMAGTYTVIISKVEQEGDGLGWPVEPWRNELIPDSVANLAAFSDVGETIPSIYNRNSNLVYKFKASPGILRPKFELKSIDPTLDEFELEDLPLK